MIKKYQHAAQRKAAQKLGKAPGKKNIFWQD
jgi:hypothetical protein